MAAVPISVSNQQSVMLNEEGIRRDALWHGSISVGVRIVDTGFRVFSARFDLPADIWTRGMDHTSLCRIRIQFVSFDHGLSKLWHRCVPELS